MVIPLLMKRGLESLFKNLRPVSNLAYISKLTERAVFDQIYDHLVRSGLYPQLQSAYRRYPSTETALVKVVNDILLNMNSQRVTLLVLLDLRATFNTVDHAILLKRLTTDFGIGGKALEWFSSYLSGRSQHVLFEGATSNSFDLRFGVPQGSCLGPLLFVVYASKLFKIVKTTCRMRTASLTTRNFTCLSILTVLRIKRWHWKPWSDASVIYVNGCTKTN